MKILYIITQADGGGAQKYVLDLAKHFGGFIAAGTESDELFKAAKKLGIPTFALSHLKRNIQPWHDVLAIWEIKRLIKKTNPDIVHLNSSKAGFLGSIAGKLAGKKVVFTAHGFFYFKRAKAVIRWAYTFLEKFASRFRDIIIAVSEEDANLAKHNQLLSHDRIITIHNGIDPIRFKDSGAARKYLGLKNTTFVFGSIAQYYKRKGLDILIQAVSLLPAEERLNLEIILLGQGPEKNNLQELIEQKNLSSIIKLAGFVPEAPTYLKAFNVFVLPSRREGFPYVLLEAMQAGLPIIATTVGGNKEAVANSAILVEADDAILLSQAMSSLRSDGELANELSAQALERSRLFSKQTMLEQTTKVYTSLMSR